MIANLVRRLYHYVTSLVDFYALMRNDDLKPGPVAVTRLSQKVN